MLHGLGSIRDDSGDRNTRSSSSTNKPNMKKKESDEGKQRTRQSNLFCPASSCCPGEVRGFATSLWSSDAQYCAKRSARVKDCNELAKSGTNLKTNLPWRVVGVPQNQFLPRQTHKFLKKNASRRVLQKNSIKTSASSFRDLQTNACSLRELNNKDEDEKATLMLPKIMHQSQQLHAVFSEKTQTMERVEWNPLRDDGLWSLTPWVENVSDEDEWFEEVTGQEELQRNETKKDNSFQASTRTYVSLPKIESPRQNALPKTEYSVKQLSSSVLPFPLLRYRRPGSDQTPNAESLTPRTPLRTNLKAIKPEFGAQE